MTPAFTARRRAEEFNALVETLSTGALRDADHASRDPRFADLLEVVGALRTAPPPAPRPEFVADLRSRLLAEADSVLVAPSGVPARTPDRTPTRTRSRERRVAVAIGGFAIVSATTSMAVAAQSALPGDTLYPLKRGIENAQVQVRSGDDDRGAALLENAAGRLDEVGELSRDGDGRAADITDTLDDFSAQAVEASDLLLDDYAETGRVSSLEEVRGFTADSLAVLQSLEGVVPPEARGALVEAARTVALIDEQAVAACPTCTDGPAAVARLFADGASLPGAIDQLTGSVRPARARTPRSSAPGGPGTATEAPTPAPGTDPTSPPPSDQAPSLPTGGNDAGDPPADGGGGDDPIGGVIDGLTGDRSGGSGSGTGTGTGTGTNGSTPGDTASTGSGLDELTTGLNDLLGGG